MIQIVNIAIRNNMVQQGDKVLVSNDGIYWELALYFEMDVCFYFDGIATSFKYIIPFNSFDISVNDITENCKKSIV